MQQQVGKINLLLTRHGQTEENIKGILCGQSPGTLTQQGQNQALRVGTFIAQSKMNFDQIYVSDIGRAVKTFQLIRSQAQHLSKVKTEFVHLLREKAAGILEGQPKDSWKKQAEKVGIPIRDFKCQKGESRKDVNDRCWQFLKTVIERHIISNKDESTKGTRVLGVTHGGYLTQFYNMYNTMLGKSSQNFQSSAKNCSFHEFVIQYPHNQEKYEVQKVKIQCTKQNSVEHLQ